MEVPASRTQIPICVFVKPPRAGAVKTRLTPEVSPAQAARIAQAFFQDTLEAVCAPDWSLPVVAAAGMADDAAARSWVRTEVSTADPGGVRAWPQGGGDLGERLERILRRALEGSGRETPHEAAIAVGTDSPGLPARFLDLAREALRTHDAVLGPCDDGGYYLIGLRRCPPGLLEGLPWSTEDTFTATRARLESRGFSVATLPRWFDVDRPEDLERLRGLLERGEIEAPATQGILRSGGLALSIVMPVLDEAARIEARLTELCALEGVHGILVVDGGSTDGTMEIARRFQPDPREAARRARRVPLRILEAPRGRATQMNAGAEAATGDVLLFVHADTTLPADAAGHVEQALRDPAVIAGAFRTWTVHDGAERRWLAPLLHLADVRSRYTALPYGDQAIFVRSESFRALGGYPEQPLMEDLELSRRLRRAGRIARVPARVQVSGRRFVERPIFYTLCVNVFPALYRAGVSSERLARIYRHVR